MSQPVPRRPPAPRPAERAKTIAVRGGPAHLLPAVGHDARDERTSPLLWHLHAGDDVSIVLPTGSPLASGLHGEATAELAVTLEITDESPLPLRQRVRGLLWLTGWLRGLDHRATRARAVAMAETAAEPERLLDVGHGLSLLRFTPVSVTLADSEGTHSLSPVTFDAAVPDPLHDYEDRWLRHLEHEHSDLVSRLSRLLPTELRDGRIRPLGLDRHGLRLRVEGEGDDHDVRLAFSRAVENPPQLAVELRKLAGCPFHHAPRQAPGTDGAS
ncbi:DUF2470 domain-containing protein [Saccharomonospora xinjiangensis]|uniref:DUF2470 domain-containing protein n=1 Tax=Saccharomonospora xinjiangensis XJ-54 TaxID=882086 RepID=I0V239_9PSEU|nr:DUF2470 domain-containing protein [Saccharomonospora xinjiangensis]EID54192.1 hypothetical protein SacxiDRAFT_1955 [Saccharomonospora xinjiangensis XJ-54]